MIFLVTTKCLMLILASSLLVHGQGPLQTDAPGVLHPMDLSDNTGGQLQATGNLQDNGRPCTHQAQNQMPYWPPGPAGQVGAPGVGGSAGIPGLPGQSGAQGARGERGDRGEPGLAGLAGTKGDKGSVGAVGLQGSMGYPGQNGTKGQKGERGQDYTAPATSAFHFGRSAGITLTSGTQIITFDSERAEGKTKTKKSKVEDVQMSERDVELASQIDGFNKSKRAESLMNMHSKDLKRKREEEESSGPKERRPFDRDVDLQANRFDEARKKNMLKKAAQLDDRFSHSKKKVFL